VLTIVAAFSQLERDLISQRTSAAPAEKSRRDGNGAGHIPYGYLRTEDGVSIDPAAEVIRRIFLLRKRCMSLRDIAADLNRRAPRSPRSNRTWQHTSVRAVLAHRDAYLGGRRGALLGARHPSTRSCARCSAISRRSRSRRRR
jgi:hypothetical protein